MSNVHQIHSRCPIVLTNNVFVEFIYRNYTFTIIQEHIRGGVNIHIPWLQPKCCSI